VASAFVFVCGTGVGKVGCYGASVPRVIADRLEEDAMEGVILATSASASFHLLAVSADLVVASVVVRLAAPW
jgi:hypothetical protein